MIGIIFCALLLAAGASYLQPKAFIEHNLADTNNSQIESLVADYNNLAMANGHRPTTADYAAVYGNGSANVKYLNNNGTTVTTSSAMAYKNSNGQIQPVGNWQFVSAGCGVGGTQDCFCLPVAGASDVIYTATQMSALRQMDSTSASRVEFSTVGCNDPAPVTDPSKWGGNPQNYYLLVVLNNAAPVPGGTPAPGGCVSNGSYSTGSLISQSCTPGCGTNAGAATAWTCIDSCGNTVAQGNCSPPPASCATSYATCTPVPQYGACSCATSTEPYTGYSCVGDGNTFSSAYCSPPGNTAALPCTPTGCTPPAGVCGATVGQCSSTTTATAVDNTHGTWTCPGTPVGQNDAACHVEIDGVCGATLGACSPGIATTPQSGTIPNTTIWTCNGMNSDTNPSSNPSQCIATNGACGTTSNNCVSGSVSTNSDGSWDCIGSSNGGTSQHCAALGSAYTASCPTYSACSSTCGTGTQTVSYTCKDANGNVVDNSNCGVSNATLTCQDFNGCTYSIPSADINYSENCADDCVGVATAEYPEWDGACQRSDGTSVPSSYCKAPGSVACLGTLHGCSSGTVQRQQAATPSPIYVYGACSNTCGTGTQTAKLLVCYGDSGACVNDMAVSAPDQPCTNYSGCTYTANGSPSSYTCTRSDGTVVPSDYCTPPAGGSCPASLNGNGTPNPITPGGGSNPPITGQCGTDADTCATGTASGYSSSQGSWACNGTNGGSNVSCTVPINGVCASAADSCAAGSPVSYNPGLQSWQCSGLNGGSNSSTCYLYGPTNGQCGSTQYSCLSGTAGNQNDNGTTSTWNCSGANGGTQAACVIGDPINGACGTTVNTCTTGTPTNESDNGTSTSWFCTGSNGGTSAGCSTNDPITYTAANPIYTCSATCGSGTQTLASYTCNGSNGSSVNVVYPGTSNCTAPATTNGSCTAYTGCFYTTVPSYSACSTSCGYGTQGLSSYTCIRSDGTTVGNSNCTAPPASIVSCESNSNCVETQGPAYGNPLNVSNDGYGCGTGVVTPPIGCQDTSGVPSPNINWCFAPDPTLAVDFTSCQVYYDGQNEYNLPDPSNYTGVGFQNESYGACPASCGVGQAPLNDSSWTCYTFNEGGGPNVPASQDVCRSYGMFPPATTPCYNYDACTVSPTYGSCNQSSNTKPLIAYTCKDSQGHYIVSSLCNAPASTASCP